MLTIRLFVAAASIVVAAALPSAALGQNSIRFLDSRPAAQLTGEYTSAAYSSAVAMNGSSPNVYFGKAVAHSKVAEDYQNFLEGLNYYYFPVGKSQYATVEEWEAAKADYLSNYGYDAVFALYYGPARRIQIEYSYYASNDVVNGVMAYKRGKWSVSTYKTYSLCIKAMELGQYDLDQE